MKRAKTALPIFFRLERQEAKNNYIEQLNINGDIAEDPKIIANFCIKDSNICEAPFSLQDIIDAINDLKNNKSLIPDGLTAEFYKAFSKTLDPFFV